MRKTPKTFTPELLDQIAALKADGAAWATVATRLKLPRAFVESAPKKHPRLWKRALALAEERVLQDATAESVIQLRKQLRSQDDKVCREAAQKLVTFRVALRKKTRPGSAKTGTKLNTISARVTTYLEGLNDEQLARVAREELADNDLETGGELDPESPPGDS